MKMSLVVSILSFLICSFSGHSQTQNINQYDQQGKRNGLWKKYYKDSHQLRYQGTFKHGEEIGTFTFYKPNSNGIPAASKTYTPGNDTLLLKFFNTKGTPIISGQTIGKNKVGIWKYYRKNNPQQLVMTEAYNRGKLNGWKIIYFPNGKVMEKRHYKNGLRDGYRFIFAKSGQLLKAYQYVNDTLQGMSRFFDENGSLIVEGNYKDGKRNGPWKFYTNGKLDSIQKFPRKMHIPNASKEL